VAVLDGVAVANGEGVGVGDAVDVGDGEGVGVEGEATGVATMRAATAVRTDLDSAAVSVADLASFVTLELAINTPRVVNVLIATNARPARIAVCFLVKPSLFFQRCF